MRKEIVFLRLWRIDCTNPIFPAPLRATDMELCFFCFVSTGLYARMIIREGEVYCFEFVDFQSAEFHCEKIAD